jgi:hypothetical protein
MVIHIIAEGFAPQSWQTDLASEHKTGQGILDLEDGDDGFIIPCLGAATNKVMTIFFFCQRRPVAFSFSLLPQLPPPNP